LVSVIISAVVAFPLILATGLGTKEVICPKGAKEKIPLKLQWKALLKNGPMLILLFCMLAHGIQMNGRLIVATYYCTYVVNNVQVFAVFNLLNSLFAIIGSVAAPTIFRLTGHKGKASAAILYICALSMALQYFTGNQIALFYILVSVTGFCYGSFSTLMFSMIPDAVDFAQYKYNVRVDGFLNAIASFGFKLGGAVITSLTGAVLSVYGYVANAQQSLECLNAIRVMMTLAPAISCFLAATALLFYKLDREGQNQIIRELQERKAL